MDKPDNPVLNNILNARKVRDIENNVYELDSNISPAEGEFIWKLIKKNNCKRTIEIGCAYGISSLYICDALSGSSSVRHTIVDPYQSTQWKNIGVENLKRAGFDFYELIEKPSELALPELLGNDVQKYDFAFIDGWHTFDHVLVDFFYINRLLKVGGVIVFDDANFESITKAIKYIVNYPAYIMYDSLKKPIIKRKLKPLNYLKIISKIFYMMRDKVSRAASNNISGQINKSPRLSSSVIALRKVSEDEREWYWYEDF
jgi:predicted O-methyltransferase YrrM